jgi:4-amino-4-deoxy-L-arabinose transferase-like glycosyltransferase
MELSADATLPLSLGKANGAIARTRFLRLSRRRVLVALAMTALFSIGIFLRVHPSAGYQKLGTDEYGYMVFVHQIETAGIWNYDAVVRVYVERQNKLQEAVVPATRAGFLLPAALCAEIFHLRAFPALHATAAAAGVLLLLLSALFAYRLGGVLPMLGVTALMATGPLEVYLCQRAMIDGYFAFWAIAALWLAWENLRHPRRAGWLLAYLFCLTILVLTKETAAFVVFAIFGVLLANRVLRLGTVTPQLLAATIAGPAIAILILASMMGGLGEFVRFYEMFAAKSRTNFYSVAAQDGPWYRYAIDFALVSPALVAFAIGGVFSLRRSDRAGLFLAAFAALALAGMSCVKYGISLRYAAFCDLPLAWLACAQVLALSRRFSSIRPAIVAVGLFSLLAALGFNQYARIFVRGGLYDPITERLVTTLEMQKPASVVRAQLAAEAKR